MWDFLDVLFLGKHTGTDRKLSLSLENEASAIYVVEYSFSCWNFPSRIYSYFLLGNILFILVLTNYLLLSGTFVLCNDGGFVSLFISCKLYSLFSSQFNLNRMSYLTTVWNRLVLIITPVTFQIQILDHLGKSLDTVFTSPDEYLLSRSRLASRSQKPVGFYIFFVFDSYLLNLAAGRHWFIFFLFFITCIRTSLSGNSVYYAW